MNTIIMIMTLLPLNLTHALKHRIPSNYPAQSPTQVGLEIDLPVKSPEPPAQGSVLVTVTAALFVTTDSLSSVITQTQTFTYSTFHLQASRGQFTFSQWSPDTV